MARETNPPNTGREQSPMFNVSVPTSLVSGNSSAQQSRQQQQQQSGPRRQMSNQNSHVFNVPKAGRPRAEHHGAKAAVNSAAFFDPSLNPYIPKWPSNSAPQDLSQNPAQNTAQAPPPNPAQNPSNGFRAPPSRSVPASNPVDDDLFAPMNAWNSSASRGLSSPGRNYKFGSPGFTSVNGVANGNSGGPPTFKFSQPTNAPVPSRPAAAPAMFSSGPVPFDPYKAPPSHSFIDLTKPQSRPKAYEIVDVEDYMNQDEANDKLKTLLEGNLGGDDIDEDDEAGPEKTEELANGAEEKLGLKEKTAQAKESSKKTKSTEDDGSRAGLKVKLLPHQIVGVKWMNQKETGGRSRKTGHPKGGILADDMGLGKTLQTIATIVTNPRPDKDSDEAKKRGIKPTVSKATLIVVPLPLLKQWQGEITKFVDSELNCKIHIHYGPKRQTVGTTMKKCDVVLTTYETLVSDYGNSNFSDGGNRIACFEVDWYRVVLDEAHRIKNPSTKQSKACCALKSHYRWCLTGTPMQNKLDEIQSLIRFLAIEPYNDMRHWKDQISNPMSRGRGGIAMKRVQVLLKAILLRRTKDLLREKGELQTVGRKVVEVVAEFAPPERALYDSLEDRMANTIDRMGSKINYANALVLLLRLRQACNHTELVKSELNKDQDALMTGNTSPRKSLATSQDVDSLADVLGSLDVDGAGLGASNCQYCGKELKTSEARRLRTCEGCNNMFDTLNDHASPSQAAEKSKRRLVRRKDKNRAAVDSGDDASILAAESEEERTHARRNRKARVIESDDEGDEAGEWLVSGDEQKYSDLGRAGGTDDEDAEGGGESLGEGDSSSDESDGELVQRRKDQRKKSTINLDSDDDDDESSPEFEDARSASISNKKSRASRAKPSGLDSDDSDDSSTDEDSESEAESSGGDIATSRNARGNPKPKARQPRSSRDSSSLVHSAKIRELMKILHGESKDHKIIVFSSFVTMLRLIEPFLLEAGLRYVHYNGQMKNDEREASLESLRSNARTRVLLCSLKSGALGLNLTAASRVVLIEPFWNPFVEEQAIDRVHRIGQKHDVVVYKLTVGGTVEQRIVALQEKKRELAKMALESGAKVQGAGALTMQQVLALFKRDAEHTGQHGDDDERFAETRGTLLRKDREGSQRSEGSGYKPRMTAKPHRPGASNRVEDPVWGRR